MNTHKIQSTIVLLLLTTLIISCSEKKETETINYGSDECSYCTMRISDNKYAAEIITSDGKVYKFDSIECLTGFAIVKNYIEDESQKFYVNDFKNPGNFIDARKSFFVHNKNFSSPMGLNVQAFSTENERDMFEKKNGGDKISWEDVMKLAQEINE